MSKLDLFNSDQRGEIAALIYNAAFTQIARIENGADIGDALKWLAEEVTRYEETGEIPGEWSVIMEDEEQT